MTPQVMDARRGAGSVGPMAAAAAVDAPVGDLLRRWRRHRRVSQMELGLEAGVSTRHLSFVETGRAHPSRGLLLRLARELEVPLRERNALLLAAGYAPAYRETPLAAAAMAPAREAIERVLAAHEPFPAVVTRRWELVAANRPLLALLEGLPPGLVAPPVNVLRLALHPDGLMTRVVNRAQWRAHLLERLHREVLAGADPALAALEHELRALPAPDGDDGSEQPGGSLFVPLVLRHGHRQLALISTVATFGTPLDVTPSELVIESFHPADAATAEALAAA